MKTILKRIIPEPIKKIIKKFMVPLDKMPLERRKRKLIKFYEEKTGKKLDLQNPSLFTEKIQWMKLYYENDELWRCVDKCEFKRYIEEKLGTGYTAKIIAEWSTPQEVCLDDLPDKFVLKSNCQGEGKFIILVKDKSIIDKDAIENEIKNNWFDSRKTLRNSFCRAYYNVTPKVLVEEYLEEFEGGVNDYKIFCFHGKPKFFYVAEEHFKDGEVVLTNYPITFFDVDWNYMDVTYGEHRQNKNAKKPKHIQQMLELATQLSKDFPYVRVDFFETEERLYLAELTFYPGGGLTPYYPESFDKEMGEWLKIS